MNTVLPVPGRRFPLGEPGLLAVSAHPISAPPSILLLVVSWTSYCLTSRESSEAWDDVTFLQTGFYFSGLTGTSWLGWAPSDGGTSLSMSQASGLVMLRPLLLAGHSLPPPPGSGAGPREPWRAQACAQMQGLARPAHRPRPPHPSDLLCCELCRPACLCSHLTHVRCRRGRVSVRAASGVCEVPVLPPRFPPPLPSEPTAALGHASGAARSLGRAGEPRGSAGFNSCGQIGLL